MLNVMIADDESIFREYLLTTLDWERYGFKISAVAKHGIEALKLVALSPPDIALIDITMPFMDGLELTEQLKEKYPQTSIVLITGHNEFDYAHRALKLGVEDYILKPFSKDELLLTLIKLQERHHQALETKSTHQTNMQMMKESMLNRLIMGDLTHHNKQHLSSFKPEELGLIWPAYTVACLEIDHMDRKWSEMNEKLLWKYAVTNILTETMETSGDLIVFNGPEGRIVCLIGHPAALSDNPAKPRLAAYEKLCLLIKKYLKFTITIGVGRSYNHLSSIPQSYSEALTALQNKFILGFDRVIGFDELTEATYGVQYPQELHDDLLHFLRTQQAEQLNIKLRELFSSIRENKLSLDYTYVICMALVSVCLSYVSEAGHPLADCFGEHFFPYSEIKRLESIEEAEQWIALLFSQVAAYTQRYKKTRASVISQMARLFIEQHYMDQDLGVDRVAQHVYIHPSYLRAVFKKELGMTVSEYIRHLRMQLAKELISGGDLRLSDIAEQIGYNDASYFSKSFKKYFGYSPSEYENKLTQD